jgi:hypothetical protein
MQPFCLICHNAKTRVFGSLGFDAWPDISTGEIGERARSAGILSNGSVWACHDHAAQLEARWREKHPRFARPDPARDEPAQPRPERGRKVSAPAPDFVQKGLFE